ncbi:serine/threonine protein kinase, partial [bacterium]|nr:serine/threonine protein kinase [bacterium]
MAGELQVGSHVSGYRILELLGRGGMGLVYKAHDARLDRIVAIKVISRELAEPRFIQRFQREARAGAAVLHPNVAQVHETGEHQGAPFLVVEYVPGGSLRELLRRQGKLDWRRAVALALPIARALAAVHEKGIVHRDLKPENVLLDEAGQPKLVDFGLARPSGASDGPGGALTRTGEVLGSFHYLAPEQADSSRTIDARADLYSLGAVLYDLLTGRPPFLGEGVALLSMHLGETPRPPRELEPSVPPALEDLVLRLLAKRPSERPSDAESTAALLG